MLKFAKVTGGILLTLISLSLSAQPIEFTVTRYDEKSGVESSNINDILQDDHGYLWFATTDGLYRYDGYTFKIYRKIKGQANSLPGNAVLKLAKDSRGRIWMGLLKDGISCFDPATGAFKNFDARKVDRSSSLARAVNMVYVDKHDNVWVGVFQKGLCRLNRNNGTFTQYNIISDTNTFYTQEFRELYNNANAMLDIGNGMYWLATPDGLYRFNSKSGALQPFRAKPLQKEKNIIRNDLFNCMIADSSGLWLGSWAGGVSHYNLKTGEWNNYKFDFHPTTVGTTNIVSDIEWKSDKEIWIASIDKGLGIFNIITRKFNFLNNSYKGKVLTGGLYTKAILQDKQQNLWLADKEGLAKVKERQKSFNYIPVKTSHTDNGPNYEISSMFEDREGDFLFIGTAFADGLHVIDKHTKAELTLPFKIMDNEEKFYMVNEVMEDRKKNIWILTRDYVYQFDRIKRPLILLPQPEGYRDRKRSNAFTGIKEDNKGNIWLTSARNGVFVYNVATKNYTHFYNIAGNKNSLPSNIVNAIAIDKRLRMWVGGSRGLFGYFDQAYNFHNLNNHILNSEGSADSRFYTLCADRKGNIWAGSDVGVYYYDAQGEELVLKNVYNSENGLKGDITLEIAEDKAGDVWCVTYAALCKINLKTGNISTFGKQDGIDVRTIPDGLYLLRDGNMALFSLAGYYVYNPETLSNKTTSIPAIVSSFKIDDVEQYFEKVVSADESMVVPAKANVISFEYAAIDFDRPDKQEFSYMLENFDKNWVMAGHRRYAGYANLPGGDYVFRVKATNTADNWNVPAYSIKIHVNEPFYRNAWFIAVIVATIAVSSYLSFRFRLVKERQILKLETKAQILEKEKALVMYENLKQQLNPHFLFNSLTSLGSLIRYDQKKAGAFLDGLSKIYRYILKSRHNETVLLSEEIVFVQTFVRLQQTRFDAGLVVNFDIDPEFNTCKIAPVTLQNLIENAIKHNVIDEELPLVIKVFIEAENDYLVVENNLQKKGFVETSNKTGLAGLTSLYKFLSTRPIIIAQDLHTFSVKVPLL